jgi:hypothetical protein
MDNGGATTTAVLLDDGAKALLLLPARSLSLLLPPGACRAHDLKHVSKAMVNCSVSSQHHAARWRMLVSKRGEKGRMWSGSVQPAAEDRIFGCDGEVSRACCSACG